MKFSSLPEFEKEVKKLRKKIPTLDEDLEVFQKSIPFVNFDKNKRFISLHVNEERTKRIIKTRLMCRSMKGSSSARIIFSFYAHEDHIEFIELYLKNNKTREDSKRIEKYERKFF